MNKVVSTIRQGWRNVRAFFEENKLDLLPVRHDLKGYQISNIGYDLKAAFNVFLLSIPQGMAYAAIAELPIFYGIIGSIIAGLIAPLFASSKHTILGPTNATAFMLFSFFASQPQISYQEKLVLIPVLVLMVGMFLVIGAYFKFADLLQYVSRSVLVGYITGAALLIITNQMKHMFGISDALTTLLNADDSPKTFFSIVGKLGELAPDYQWQPILIGLATLAVYLVLSKKLPTLPNFAITLALASFVTCLLRKSPTFENIDCFTAFQLDQITPAMPPLSFSTFSMLLGVASAITFLASLENTVMSKTIASQTGDRLDPNQDMLSLGMANIGCSFLCPMPASSSLTRSALNFASGARSRFSSIICSVFCLAGFFLLIFVPIVENIPKTALAGLVIGIAISLIKWKNIRICVRSTTDDAFVIITTFAATLLTRLDYAIFIGVALSITLFLRKASKPHLVEYEVSDDGDLRELGEKRKRPNPQISIVHVEGDLFFGAAELFRTQVQRVASDPNLKVIILRLKNARHLDATSVMAMEELIKYMRNEDRHVLISGATRDVYKVLKLSGVLDTVLDGCDRKQGETNLFFYSPSNPNISTRDALIRAQELLGTKKADIKIYYDPAHDKKS